MDVEHPPVVPLGVVRQDAAVWLVEGREVRPAELGRLAVPPDQQRGEVQERVRCGALVGDVDVLGAERAYDDGPSQAGWCCGREAAGPLHGRADRQTALDVEVLAPADLLPGEQRGRARQGEHQAVGRRDSVRVAVEHGRQSTPQSSAEELQLGFRAEGGKDLVALALRLSSVSSSWLRRNDAHWASGLMVGRRFRVRASGRAP